MAWLPALFSPGGTIRRTMIWPRRLRLGHCTAFPVDFYKQWSATLHPTSSGSSHGKHTEEFDTSAPGDSVFRGRLSSRRVLIGMAEDVVTRPTFFGTGGHRFAVAALGYEASEPPRGVAWVTRIWTQRKKGT